MDTIRLWAIRYAAGILIISVLAVADVAGQSDASITGRVTDESGAVLPGVTVTAASPALQVPSVTALTNELGEYRLSPIPIGTYTVTYELSGFTSIRREGVRLTVGFIARLDVALKVGGLAETITVAAGAPVVDVTSSATGTQFTRETLELLPGSRSGIQGIIAQAPGVRAAFDVGGDTMNFSPTARVFGQSGEQWYLYDGVPTTDMKDNGAAGNYWDYGNMEEAVVRTLGSSAEAPTRGLQLNAVVKSGGNEFHGSTTANYTNDSFQWENIDEELAASGITRGNPIRERHDYTGELGGRLIRDKLWFYGSARVRKFAQEALGAVKDDGSPAVLTQLNTFYTGKLSLQMSHSHKLTGLLSTTPKSSEELANQFVSWESRSNPKAFMTISKVEWQGVLRNDIVVEVLGGQWWFNTGSPALVPDQVSRTDLTTLQVTGENQNRGGWLINTRRSAKGNLEWYKPDWFYGNHSFKTGIDYFRHGHSNGVGPKIYNYRLIYQNAVPFQMAAYNFPTDPWIATNYVGVYGQDSWTLKRRLTLNVGLRFTHDNGFVPAVSRQAADPPGDLAFPAASFPRKQRAIWTSVAPRLHLAWDVTGDGRTSIKAGWGRFDHMRQIDPDTKRLDEMTINTAVYRWRDLNGNNDYDAGEVNLDPNGPDFVSTTAGAYAVANTNEIQPTSDEFSASVEREVRPNMSIRVTGIYSRYTNSERLQNNKRPYESYSVPVTNRDPGNDGVVGTADDSGTSITYYEFPRTLNGKAFEEFMIINDPSVDQNYKSVEVAAFKRLAHRWQFMASYSATKKNIPVFNALTARFNNEDGPQVQSGPYNPNAEINQADRTWEWQAKINAAVFLPAGLMVSSNFDHRSGDVYARQVQFRGGQTIPSIVLNAEPLGTRRIPNTYLVDMRVEETLHIRGAQKVALRVNVYNLLNGNTTTRLIMRAGSSFELPTAIMAPRIAEFGATYSF